eukprot:2040542-Pleurochrysis_carterae.AAC.2
MATETKEIAQRRPRVGSGARCGLRTLLARCTSAAEAEARRRAVYRTRRRSRRLHRWLRARGENESVSEDVCRGSHQHDSRSDVDNGRMSGKSRHVPLVDAQ